MRAAVSDVKLRRIAQAIRKAGLTGLVEEMASCDRLLSSPSPSVQRGLAEGAHGWSVYQELKRLCRRIAAAVRAPDEEIEPLAGWLLLHAREVIRSVRSGGTRTGDHAGTT